MFTKTEIIEQYLLKEIISGKQQPGTRIPSQTKLMNKFSCSRTTVERAIARLVQSGHLVSCQGAGTFVQTIPRNTIREILIIGYNGPMYPFSEAFFGLDSSSGVPARWIDPLYTLENLSHLTQPDHAVIWCLPAEDQIMLIKYLKSRNVPQLLINRNYGDFDRIETDIRASLREGLQWLMSHAGREIAFITRTPSVQRPYLAERLIAFHELCFEYGANLPSGSICNMDFKNLTDCFKLIGERLFEYRQIPKGIFVMDFDLVIPTLMCASKYGLKAGRDFFILTFDRIPDLHDTKGIAMMCQAYSLFREQILQWTVRLKTGSRIPFQMAIKTLLLSSSEDS